MNHEMELAFIQLVTLTLRQPPEFFNTPVAGAIGRMCKAYADTKDQMMEDRRPENVVLLRDHHHGRVK